MGGMSMTYSYFDLNGTYKTASNIDIVSLMDEYAGRTSSYVRRTALESENLTVDYAVSDPSYNFRGYTTDMFYMTVKDISQFINLTLQLKGDVVTQWNITDVKIYLVNGTGTRFLNSNGEYDYRYADGAEPELVAQWTQKDGLTALVSLYRKAQNTSIAEIRNIVLDSSKIEISEDASKWTSTITREPKSKDDIFNLFIYPQGESEDSVDPDSYTLKAAVRYKDASNLKQVQSSAGTLRKQYDEDGNLVCFYALGISASNIDTICGVDVETNSATPIRAPLTYGVLQQVRSGVLIESYLLSGVGNADLGDTMYISNSSTNKTTQKVLLQLSSDTKEQSLDAEAKELAVAIHFKSDDPSNTELRSKYVYLTDQGYTSIKANQLLELNMNLGNIDEITGVSLVTLGNLDLTIDNLMVSDLAADGTLLHSFSTSGPIVPTKTPVRVGESGTVSVLQLELTTAEDESSVSSGTTGPVSMTVGYYDVYGELREESYDDIREYIDSGEGFKAGGTDTVRLLIPNFDELRWLEFEPVSASGTSSGAATWKLASVSASVGVDGRAVTRTVNSLIIEGEPLRVGMAEIILYGTLKSDDSSSKTTVTSGGTVSYLLDSGEGVSIMNTVYGSSEGVSYELYKYDPTSGASSSVRLGVTHSYTDDYLEQIYDSASESAQSSTASDSEKQAAQKVMEVVTVLQNSAGKLTQSGSTLYFTAPRNYTGRDLYYRVKVYSNELTDSSYIVDLTVYSESDPLPDAIAEWKAAQSDAQSTSTDTSTDTTTDTNTDSSTDSGGSDG